MLRRIYLIAKRDYINSVFRKAFLIGLVVAPLMFGGSFLGIGLLRMTGNNQQRKIAMLDHTSSGAGDAIIQAASEKNAKELLSKATQQLVTAHYEFEVVAPDEGDSQGQRLALSNRVRNGDLYMFIDVGPAAVHSNGKPGDEKVTIFANADGVDDTRLWLLDPINTGLRRLRLKELGVDADHSSEVLGTASIERMGLFSKDSQTGVVEPARPRNELEGVAVPVVMLFLMFMVVMGGAAPMLGVVAEDKMQRVFEMLLASVTPFEILAGKVLASVGRSLTSSVFYILGALLGLQGAAMLGLMPFHLMPWFFAFMIAEVTMLSALGAGLGAAVSAPRDAQNMTIFMLLPILIPAFLLVTIVQQPNGTAATALSLFPLFSPLVMLMRQAMPGGVPAWQPWAALLGSFSCALLITWGAARIFRVAILLQGKPPRIADLFRYAIRG
ncbi:MAG: ABC transporter permease [Acidobacteriota bacterium]